jgi:hypothetical protein
MAMKFDESETVLLSTRRNQEYHLDRYAVSRWSQTGKARESFVLR